jgi:hypothetical protein
MICAAVERCAGIDVGRKWLSVCVMIGPLSGKPESRSGGLARRCLTYSSFSVGLRKKGSRMS